MNNLFSMEGKTVVFTGGAGNLGQVLVKSLLEYGLVYPYLIFRINLTKALIHIRKTAS